MKYMSEQQYCAALKRSIDEEENATVRSGLQEGYDRICANVDHGEIEDHPNATPAPSGDGD